MRRCQLQNSLWIESVVGKYGQNLEYPRSPEPNCWKGAVASLQVWIQHFKCYYIVSHGISFYITLTISLRFMTAAPWTVSESILELRTWLPGASPRLSEETRENAWNMHDKQGKEIVLLCVSFARRGEHWCCTWCKDIVKMDHWKSLMTDDWWWLRRWWRRLNMVSSQCLTCPFQVLQIYHRMELALCRGPVWEDILTGKWAHFQLGTGNEKKPRQTESKSKQIPMRPGWGNRPHRFEPNGGFCFRNHSRVTVICTFWGRGLGWPRSGFSKRMLVPRPPSTINTAQRSVNNDVSVLELNFWLWLWSSHGQADSWRARAVGRLPLLCLSRARSRWCLAFRVPQSMGSWVSWVMSIAVDAVYSSHPTHPYPTFT